MRKFVGFLTDSGCQESGRRRGDDEDIPDQTPGDHQSHDPLVRLPPLAGINILPSIKWIFDPKTQDIFHSEIYTF